MELYLILASTETLLMAVVVAGGIRYWRRTDQGARLVLAGTAVFLIHALIAARMSLAGQSTRLLQEGTWLVGTLIMVLGFVAWQPKPEQRRPLWVAAGGFVVLWCFAQWAQGWRSDFSHLSGPLHSVTIVGAAAYTLIARLQVGFEQWTGQLWFWFCTGLMTVYGTGAILDPLMANVFRVRDDLLTIAYYFRLLGGIAGYVLMTWGVWRLGRSTRAETRIVDPLPAP